jgi:hypothetical protein
MPETTWAYEGRVNASQRVYKMRSFQEMLSIFNDNTTDLLNQFSELNQLRERLRKAEQSALKVRQSKRRKKTPIEHEAHP